MRNADVKELRCFFCGEKTGEKGTPRYGVPGLDIDACDECLRDVPDALGILREFRLTYAVEQECFGIG